MTHFKHGEWLVTCDRCGWKRFASQVTETWDGLIVCKPSIKNGCFETRHPQDFIKQIKDDSSVPFIRSRPADVYASDAAEFNCTTAEEVAVQQSAVQNMGLVYINKGLSYGPITVINTEVIVNCTWTIL